VDGKAILMDFGIARIVGGQLHTATGAVVGTAMYMSPEQIVGERADERSDIYSLGVTLFETISGRPPFQSDSAMTLMMMHVNDPVPDLRELTPDVPFALVRVVEKALAKKRPDRYQSMREMVAALRAVQQRQSGAEVEPPSALETFLEAPPTPSRPPEPIQTQVIAAADAPEAAAPEIPAPAPAILPEAEPEVISPTSEQPPEAQQETPPAEPAPLTQVPAAETRFEEPPTPQPEVEDATLAERMPAEDIAAAEPEPAVPAVRAPVEDDAFYAHPAFHAPVTPPAASRPVEDATFDARAPAGPVYYPSSDSASLSRPVEDATFDALAFSKPVEDATFDALASSRPVDEDATLVEGVTGRPPAATRKPAPVYVPPPPLPVKRPTRPGLPLVAVLGGLGLVLVVALLLILRGARQTRLEARAARLTQQAQVTVVSPASTSVPPSAAPSATLPAVMATATQPAKPTAPAATLPPTQLPTVTIPPGVTLYARITGIHVASGAYVVEYEPVGFAAQDERILHFFYDTVPPTQAGKPGAGPWIEFGGPPPFKGFSVASRPANAKNICALVANPDQSIQLNSGNCYPLP
jgi:hypothetical protein